MGRARSHEVQENSATGLFVLIYVMFFAVCVNALYTADYEKIDSKQNVSRVSKAGKSEEFGAEIMVGELSVDTEP